MLQKIESMHICSETKCVFNLPLPCNMNDKKFHLGKKYINLVRDETFVNNLRFHISLIDNYAE